MLRMVTIETFNRAKKSGLEMIISERENESRYEMIIAVPKIKHKHHLAAK